MYVSPNFKSRAELKRALAAGQAIRVYDHAGLRQPPVDGKVQLEGPHYPKAHTWYATGIMKDGKLIKVN